MTERRTDIDDAADKILADLDIKTYEQVAADWGTSRGKVYSLAMARGARKHESRIRERKAERARRQQEFLQEVMNASQKADVLDFLAGMPEESVALHFTSPPYNVGKNYGGSGDSDRLRFHFYLGFLLQVVSEMHRTLMPGGVLALQTGQTRDDGGQLCPLDTVLFSYLKEMGLLYQSRVAWCIPHGLTPDRRLAERYETILIFSKGEPRVFNPNPVRTPQKQPGKRAFKGPNKGNLSGHPFGSHPTNVWQIGNVGHNHPEKTFGPHPAQMPGEVARRTILLYTNPGDLVSDVFEGSGTTHVECKKLHRAFVGCDLFYEDLRQKRLANVAPEMVCQLPGVTDESLAVWQAEAREVRYAPSPESILHEKQMMLVEFPAVAVDEVGAKGQ